MLLSQKAERSRRFTLALRAGIPVLLLIFLLFATTLTSDKFSFGTKEIVLLTLSVFITIYFIYFLINLSVQETLLDHITHSFNIKAFVSQLKSYKPKSLVCLKIENLASLNEHYSMQQVDALLYKTSQNIHVAFKGVGLKNILIG
jgi:hypothetical protein